MTFNSCKTVSYFSFWDEFWGVNFLVPQTQHSINSVVEFVHNLKSCYKYMDDWVKGFRVKQTVCYQSFMRRILNSKHLELRSVTFCSVSFNLQPLSVNNEWMHIGQLRNTVKAAYRKFISFMSFENITFTYRAFQVWAWPLLENIARVKSMYWGWPILFINWSHDVTVTWYS